MLIQVGSNKWNFKIQINFTNLICEESYEDGGIAHHPQHNDDAVQGYQRVVGHGL